MFAQKPAEVKQSQQRQVYGSFLHLLIVVSDGLVGGSEVSGRNALNILGGDFVLETEIEAVKAALPKPGKIKRALPQGF